MRKASKISSPNLDAIENSTLNENIFPIDFIGAVRRCVNLESFELCPLFQKTGDRQEKNGLRQTMATGRS